MSKKALIPYLLMALMASSASAQMAGDIATRGMRELHREARDMRILTRSADKVSDPSASMTLGLVHDRSEDDSKVLATPFVLDYKTAGTENDWWRFQLLGDGYVHVTVPGEASASGAGDLAFSVYRPLAPKLIGVVGVGMPSHGEVGSKHWSLNGKLIYRDSITDQWSYRIMGRVAHQRNDAPDVSAVSTLLYGQLGYDLGGQRSLGLGLSRQYRRGAGGATELGLEYDFPIAERLDAALSLSRGLSKGARHTAVEFDLSYSF
ncbi:MAG TPA: hypothetical protein VK195_09695 [Burkholderiaceae bacterium]|nr:hypothetical protein [Burkholderiaceae bacterium]